MNPLYDALIGRGQSTPRIGRIAQIMSAMQNPAQFVKQQFPDIPNEIQNNPHQILQYLQQTRGITNQQIQQAQEMATQIQGNGTVR